MGLLNLLSMKTVTADRLADQVGGSDALAELDDQPLPDEPFDWTGLDDDLRAPLGHVLELADAGCDRFFDVEHCTAVRRLLHDVALAKPRTFTGRGRPESAAAAACWLVARANDGPRSPDVVPTQELMAHFGVTGSPSSRANTMREAIGARSVRMPGSLGSVRYLTAEQRRYLIRQRDEV